MEPSWSPLPDQVFACRCCQALASSCSASSPLSRPTASVACGRCRRRPHGTAGGHVGEVVVLQTVKAISDGELRPCEVHRFKLTHNGATTIELH